MLKYDFIPTDEPFKFRVVDRETGKDFNIGKDLCDRYDSGEFAWTVEKKKK